MQTRSSLGDRLKALRADKGGSQDEAADAIGISRTYLAGLETDQDKPGRDTLFAIATYYGVSTDWLGTGEGDPHARPLEERTARLVGLFEALPDSDKDTLEGLAERLSQRP